MKWINLDYLRYVFNPEKFDRDETWLDVVKRWICRSKGHPHEHYHAGCTTATEPNYCCNNCGEEL